MNSAPYDLCKKSPECATPGSNGPTHFVSSDPGAGSLPTKASDHDVWGLISSSDSGAGSLSTKVIDHDVWGLLSNQYIQLMPIYVVRYNETKTFWCPNSFFQLSTC